ncbi:proteasome subunit beta type-4 [Brachionus plicatilis]|uniref:Proteasome subunit beta n=1 Tax=Brachionus plicatilis TaxID=10195 RepID=A0A3M7Q481_BRAPC|nr:proteasome subunit beta type-4 [Brachionus plicatilis]
MEHPKQQTQNPMVTGTSVLGIQFDGGVLIAADLLGSYGSMAQMRQLQRVFKVNEKTVIGASGDYSDYQFLLEKIMQKVNQDNCLNDGYVYKPKQLFSWCTRVLYNRRSNFDPLWNRLVIAGLENEQPFLGCVDLLGNAYQAPCMATGYGNYLAVPIMREFLEKHNNRITEAQARDVIDRCMKLLYYRDGRAYDKYSIAIVTREGSRVEECKELQTNWSVASQISSYD